MLPASRRATLVLFFTGGCETCWRVLRALDDLYRQRQKDGVLVVGVAGAWGSPPEAEESLKVSYPIVGIEDDTAVRQAFSVRAGPLVALVDARGVIQWVGYELDALFHALDRVLREPTPSLS